MSVWVRIDTARCGMVEYRYMYLYVTVDTGVSKYREILDKVGISLGMHRYKWV